MRTFHVKLLFQATTKSYSIHCGAINDALKVLAPFIFN